MDSLTLTVWAINRPHDSLYSVNSRVHSKECAGSRVKRLLAQPAIVRMFGMAIRVQPGQQIANTAVRQRNARIGGGDIPILLASHQAPRRASSMSL